MPSARLVGTGAFVILGLLLFALALFMVGERRMTFREKFTIYAEFARVTGLQPGAPVRVAGMEAGEVKEIAVPPGPASKFRVKLEVRQDMHQLVRTDSVASIQTEGLVGGTFLQINIGSQQAPEAPEESTIAGRESLGVADLLRQMSDTVAMIDETIKKLKGDVELTVAAIRETAEHADVLVEVVGEDVKRITASGSRVASDTQAIVDGIRAGRGTMGKLITDDELYVRARDISEQAQRAVENMRRASEEARRAFEGLRSKEGPAQGLAADLRQTLADAREAISDLAENAEALKHNWFFRGFFRNRGYFDLGTISPADYRRGLLAAGGRQTLRVWLSAAVLFSISPAGLESISEEGKARLDSAMGAFLPYRREGPFVVEGYATRGTREQRFLASQERGRMVRDYLVARFSLDPKATGLMALGGEADGSPAGKTWDGVALAVFVPRNVLQREATPRGEPPQ